MSPPVIRTTITLDPASIAILCTDTTVSPITTTALRGTSPDEPSTTATPTSLGNREGFSSGKQGGDLSKCAFRVGRRQGTQSNTKWRFLRQRRYSSKPRVASEANYPGLTSSRSSYPVWVASLAIVERSNPFRVKNARFGKCPRVRSRRLATLGFDIQHLWCKDIQKWICCELRCNRRAQLWSEHCFIGAPEAVPATTSFNDKSWQ